MEWSQHETVGTRSIIGLTAEHVRRVYGSGAKHYDRIMETVYADLINRARVMEALAPKKGESILEVGIGTGLNIPYYPLGVSLTGTDFTREMLVEAEQKRSSFRGTRLELVLEDSACLPYREGTFDAVLGTLTLCVMQQPEAGLREMQRVCKLGGRIVIFEMARSPHPIIADMQEILLRPRTTTVGFPPAAPDFPHGVIVWDPTHDYVVMGNTLGLDESVVEWTNADHPVMARVLICWLRG